MKSSTSTREVKREVNIAAAYDQIAERWLDERFAQQSNGIRQHQRALAFLAEADDGWALNVGCGCNTRFNPLLRERGLQIEGVDVSRRMVELARAADPTVAVHHADICDWPPPRRYRFITAWDSIWHVRLDRQRALLLKLMDMLEPGGVMIFSAGGLDEPNQHTDDAMGVDVYNATLGVPGILDAVREAGAVCRHLEYDQFPPSLLHLVVVVQRGR